MLPPDDVERLAVGPEVAAVMLGVSRATLFKLLKTGEVASFSIGTRRLIAVEVLRAFVAERSGHSTPAELSILPAPHHAPKRAPNAA